MCVEDVRQDDLCEPVKSELVGGFRASSDTPFSSFSPGVTALNETIKPEHIPEHRSHQCEQPAELVLPLVEPGNIAQQKTGKQGSPNLPSHGVFAIAEEVRQLKRLLDFLEEDLHAPAALVELADGMGGPLQIVADESHL